MYDPQKFYENGIEITREQRDAILKQLDADLVELTKPTAVERIALSLESISASLVRIASTTPR